MASDVVHRVRPGQFDEPPGIGAGAFTVLVLHGAAAMVLVALVYGLRVLDDMTAVWVGFYGGVTQLVYVVPLLVRRRGPQWRRFRIGVLIMASITFALSVAIICGLSTLRLGYVRR